MADVGGIFGTDPVQAARDAADARDQARLQSIAAAAGNPNTNLARMAGAFIGGGLASGFLKGVGYEDPTVKAAKKDAQLLKQFNGIEGDPASAKWAKNAAELATKNDRPDLALKFGQLYGERAKAEAKLQAATAQQSVENWKGNFGALPQTAKLSVLHSMDATDIATKFGVTPENAKQIKEDAKTSMETLDLKNKAALDALRADKISGVSKQDVENTASAMKLSGLRPAIKGWGGLNEEAFNGLVTVVAEHVSALQDQLAKQHKPTDAAALRAQTIADLKTQGAITTEPSWLGGEVVTSVNPAKVQEVFAGAAPATGSTTATPATLSPEYKAALEWANANPNDPRAAAIHQKIGQ